MFIILYKHFNETIFLDIKGNVVTRSKLLIGRNIFLRLLEESDKLFYMQQFSELVRSLLHVESIQQEEAYFQEHIFFNKSYFWGIFDLTTNNLCGAIEIRDPGQHRGQLYCWLNEAWWQKGYIQEAIVLAAEEYWNKTNVRFITALVDESNKRSYWSLKKAGFVDVAKIKGPYGKQYELILRNKRV